ncbi:Hsp20/alpha crystallin family protein [Lentisphaerota bacterium ZTH]|nr:Hsp20/alpha crystallin family protein [Lentisphaerota bacterium]WET05823.1 Hsp20/alpha crystallin family protein [Lentisphaerota bacterium ZTH]
MIKELFPWRKKSNSSELTKYEPKNIFSEFHSEMNSLFDRFFNELSMQTNWPTSFKSEFSPKFDVSEAKKEISIKAELPGMNEKDISVDVFDNYLRIKGEKKEENFSKDDKTHLAECQYGYFERTFPLFDNIDAKNIKANFKNGVLTLKLPKVKEEPSNVKKIEINK